MDLLLCSTPHSPGSFLFHCLSPTNLLLGLLRPTAWGGFKSIVRNPLQTDPFAPLSLKQPLGGQLMFPTILPSPILFPFLSCWLPCSIWCHCLKLQSALWRSAFLAGWWGWAGHRSVGSVFEFIWGPATLQTQLLGYPQETQALFLYPLWAEVSSVLHMG